MNKPCACFHLTSLGILQAREHGIPVGYVRREARFSAKYENYSLWTARHHTSSYERRVSSYMSSHPHATLREARGHRKRCTMLLYWVGMKSNSKHGFLDLYLSNTCIVVVPYV